MTPLPHFSATVLVVALVGVPTGLTSGRLAQLAPLQPIQSVFAVEETDPSPLRCNPFPSSCLRVSVTPFIQSGAGTASSPWVGPLGGGGILAAVASLPPNTACAVVLCPSGHFDLSGSLALPAGVSVAGNGSTRTVLHKTGRGHLGVLQTRSSLRSLAVIGNGGDGVMVAGPDCAACGVALSNVFLSGFRVAEAAQFFSLVNSTLVDVYYGIWAEATCGYAGHRVLGNAVGLTRALPPPGQGMGFNYDNGNADGLLNCTDPPPPLRPAMTNLIQDNHIASFGQFGIAVARGHGFTVRGNTVLHGVHSGEGWGNAIHFEHSCRDVLIEGNFASHPVGGSISATGSSNVTIANNVVRVEPTTPPSEACIIADNNRYPVVLASGLSIVNNSVSGCNVGVDVWGNSSAATFDGVTIAGNKVANTTRGGVQLGGVMRGTIANNTIHDAGAFVTILAYGGNLTVVPPFALVGNIGVRVADCSLSHLPHGPGVEISNNQCGG